MSTLQLETSTIDSRFAGAFQLVHKVSITIPTEANGGPIQPENWETVVRYIETRLTRCCGGSTRSPVAVGCWFSEERDCLVRESVVVLESYVAADSYLGAVDTLWSCAVYVKAQLEQEVVLVVIDHIAYLV